MEKVGSSLAEYRKTIIAAITGFAGVIGNAIIQNGDITAADLRIAIGAAILAAVGVWGIPNKNIVAENVKELVHRYEVRAASPAAATPVVPAETVVEDLKTAVQK